MKKHILSKYATSKIRTRHLDRYAGPTEQTFTKEDSDPDEFMMGGPTIITENIETSDPDEFYFYVNSAESTVIQDGDFDEFL